MKISLNFLCASDEKFEKATHDAVFCDALINRLMRARCLNIYALVFQLVFLCALDVFKKITLDSFSEELGENATIISLMFSVYFVHLVLLQLCAMAVGGGSFIALDSQIKMLKMMRASKSQ